MKRIYILVLTILFVFISGSIYSQITIVDAVAVDGDSNGQYGTVEIQFSVGVDDSDIKDPGDRDDWEFSLDPEFSSVLTPSSFSTEVSYIAIDADADDEYIQFTFNSEFASSDGPIYFRYTQEGDKIWDSATGNTDSLPNFSLKSARDITPPRISSVTSVQIASGDTLIVGDKIIFTVDFHDPVPNGNLTILPLQYNGGDLNWYTDNGGDTYKGIYIVEDGQTDQKTPLQLVDVTAEDEYGNVSDSSDPDADGSDVTKGIDANIPKIKAGGVTSSPITADTLIVGQSITFTVDIDDAASDPTLTILPSQYNGENLNWSTSDGGDTYQGTYTIVEGNQDHFTPLQLTGVTATDPSGNISDIANGSDVVVSIDANTPVINSVTSDATASGVLKIGDKINFIADIDVKDPNLTLSSGQYNGEDLNWNTTDGGSTYKATYTVVAGNTDQTGALQLTGVTATDPAGNISASKDGNDINKTIDANAPVIVGNVNVTETGSGTSVVGDSIIFTVDVSVSEENLTVNPSTFNGRSLNWKTENGGDTYEGIYVVTEGDQDRPDTYDLSNVTLTDPAGNVSNVSTGDITLAIDANSPVINDVAVVATTMLYGQDYTIKVAVKSDGDTYSLVSGKLAGFNLHTLSKDADDTYSLDFTVGSLGYDILEEDSYDVFNLVLSDPAGNLSNVFFKTITQPGDPIYAMLPTAKTKGNHYVCAGDSAELTFQLTGNAPWEVDLFDGSSTTTISNIDDSPYLYKVGTSDINALVDPDTVIYKIIKVTDVNGNYKNMPGNDSSTVFINELPDVYFTDPAGDQTYNINDQDADTLKGSPVGGIFSGDGVVSANNTFLPSSAGLGTHEIVYRYTAPITGCSDSDTLEFDVVDSDANITFENDDAWRCDYESTFNVSATVLSNPSIVGSLHMYSVPSAITSTGNNTAKIDVQQLSAGSYEVTFEYVDNLIPFSVTKSFTVESVSSSIDITDIDDVCEDYDSIFVNAVNLSPGGGTGEYIFAGAGGAFEYDPSNPSNNSGYLLPGTITPGAYNLKYVYTTPNGCESDTVKKVFNVNPLPNVSFTMNSVYNIDQGETTITGNQSGGEFTPLSFMSNIGGGQATFDPQDAGLGTWWVKYTYEDANGCINADSTQIEVNQALGDITSKLGTFQYCYFNTDVDTLVGTPNPTDGSPGNFYIDNVLIAPFANNKILFNPQDYIAGDHTVKYEYNNGPTTYYVYKTVNIDSIGNIYFTGLDQQYCEDEDIEVELTAFYPGQDGSMQFSGNGITDDVDDNLGYFNPSDANLGDNTINYTFTRDYSGCQKNYTKMTTIHKTPTVAFNPSEKCIVGANSTLGFVPVIVETDSVEVWSWKYANRTSNDTVAYFELDPGYSTVGLKLETKFGCTNNIDSSFYIGTRVNLDFTFENECHGETVLFELLKTSDPADTLSTNWYFGGSGEADFTNPDKPTYKYDDPGEYDVVYEEILKSCGRIADTVTLNIRPSIDLSTEDYLEDFEDTPSTTGWVVEDFGTNVSANSWQWGVPAGEKINSAPSGQNAFVTNLSGSYDFEESGMVTSPCFDFSSMKRPMMKMDFISYSEKDRDGAVIQYTKANGDWATIGVPNDGINWYNSYIISGAPANQQLGWTGQIFGDENNGWQTAMYRLDELRGRAGVRFRIVFGSDAAGTGYEGFAFDNVQFNERKRTVLLENFTNISDNDALNILEGIDNELEKDSLDLISLNYHTSFPGSNELNTFYPSGPGARALYYGVSRVPYSIVDGVSKFSYLSGQNLTESNIHKRMLVDPSFDISLKQNVQGNNFVMSSGVKALEDLNGYKLTVFVAVAEKTVVQGDETYHNVLRTMLPDAAGTLVEREWFAGDSVKIYQTWTIPEGVNPDSLITIVFVQDNDTREIYQTTYTSKYSTITSDNVIQNNSVSEYSVYPNPTKENITIQLNNIFSKDINVNIYDGVGKLVKTDILPKGESLLRTNIKELPVGVYYIKLNTESGNVFGVSKIIKSE